MERYLDLTERNSATVGDDIHNIAIRLDSIDDRLAELSARTAKIEGALRIKQPAAPIREPSEPGIAAPGPEVRFENPR